MGERRGTKALELWCKRMIDGYPGVKIDNMTTSWRNGLAFCALVHRFRPDLIDFDKLNKDNVYYNNDLAFRTAEEQLGIPALLDADDMESYSPDRLSILTYLSQFYQVFAAQDQSNRLKRASATTEHTAISKAPGPPPKMAHIVPKREPCQKCSLPVFLAERIKIGSKIYHRTCLKCARCNSQLTLGSFYETEIDNEFCCETCPDEEILRPSNEIKNESLEFNDAKTRNSIADRLAFFERNSINTPTVSNVDSISTTSKVLQKSLSDEEKTRSLKKITENLATNNLTVELEGAIAESSRSAGSESDEEVSHSLNTSENTDSEYTTTKWADMSEIKVPELPKLPPPLFKSNVVDIPGKISNFAFSINEENIFDEEADFVVETDVSELLELPQFKLEQVEELADTKNINVTKDILRNEQIETFDNNVQQIINEQEDSGIKGVNVKSTEDNLDDSIGNELLRHEPAEDSRLVCEYKTDHKDETNHPAETDHTDKNLEVSSNDRKSLVLSRLRQFETCIPNTINEDTEKTNNKSILLKNDKFVKDIESDENNSNNDEEKMNVTEVPIPDIIENDSFTEEHINDNKIDMKENELENVNCTHIEVDSINNNEEYGSEEEKIKKLSEDDNNKKIIEEVLIHNENQQVEIKLEKNINLIKIKSVEDIAMVSKPRSKHKNTIKKEEYPTELNPFGSDDEENDCNQIDSIKLSEKRKSLNPFGSSDEEDNENQIDEKKLKPPRPPPPKISTNPFGSDSDEENDNSINVSEKSNNSAKSTRRTPVPTPRTQIASKTSTPEPTPRLSTRNSALNQYRDYHGSFQSLNTSYSGQRHSEFHGSNNSISSSSGSSTIIRSRKTKKAPAPPPPTFTVAKELFPDSGSKKSTPNSSKSGTPTSTRKKRPAPKPPSLINSTEKLTENDEFSEKTIHLEFSQDKSLLLNDANKSLHSSENDIFMSITLENEIANRDSKMNVRRIIPVGASFMNDDIDCSANDESKNSENITYRRKIPAPAELSTPSKNVPPTSYINDEMYGYDSYDRQSEKLKDNKEAKNRNRQSQVSNEDSSSTNGDSVMLNKSIHGKWKRRKGPAPSLPIPPRKVLQMLPLQEIRHELDIIEVQQQGLEKQGVVLEKMIRERCEGKNGELIKPDNNCDINSKEVEDLILQLFELVNEKNELFRRQAELMYLRRQHRLEQEQADLEYEIRVLMARPERNKPDSDKAREEALIARLVEVVQLRNEVIECLEMDRLREAEEDMSIKQRLEMHTAKREEQLNNASSLKLSKKEKKKQKESKKLGKSKKLDADKDADESELNADTQKLKKKKKKFLFGHL